MKRISACFVCVLLVLSFSLSVSAADVEYYPTSSDSEGMYFDYPLPEGYYQGWAYLSDGSFLYTDAINLDFSDEYMGYPATIDKVGYYLLVGGKPVYYSDYPIYLIFIRIDDSQIRAGFRFVNGSPDAMNGLDVVGFSLRPSEPESHLMDSVSDNLNVVVSWVGNVVDSLTDGPLFPLLAMLALPVSISALFVGIKALKKSSWGV